METVEAPGASGLNRLRLLVALDALLMEGSVGGAARRMGMGTPAMSRLLAQLRSFYGDPIFIRTGQGMVPTAFAESVRVRVRALAAEAEALLEGVPQVDMAAGARRPPVERSQAILPAPPLASRPVLKLEDQPMPEDIARKLALISESTDPRRKLARAIALIGGGAAGSRPLGQEEAEEAFSIVLEGQADPIQIGAFLTLLQHRGLTAVELAGLVSAARRHCGALPVGMRHDTLDWPAYLSPKLCLAPWFLHSARLVAQAGHKVLLHGHHGSIGWLNQAVTVAGIPVCASIREADATLEERGIAFLPVTAFAPQVSALLSLYPLFELRSPLHKVVHLLNPLGAARSLLGVSNPSYPAQHRDTAQLLGWRDFSLLGTRRDVAQATPFRSTLVHRLKDGMSSEEVVASRPDPGGEARPALSSLEYWQALWKGQVRDERAHAIVLATTAFALQLCEGGSHGEGYSQALAKAGELWALRPVSK